MSEDGDREDPRRRSIRSYVMRAGRMTDAQARALDGLWPRYGIGAGEEPLQLAQLFGREATCTLEIGFGNGDNLVALAREHPESNFLGAEVHRPGVGHLLQQAARAELANLRVTMEDAVEFLQRRIAPGALDSILVLFPDPWHKKRHHKRRIINAGFAALAASRLKTGGTLQLATDWTPYAEWMCEVLNAVPGFRNRSPDGTYVPRNPGRSRTRFEARGERLGHAVHDLCFERISASGREPSSRR